MYGDLLRRAALALGLLGGLESLAFWVSASTQVGGEAFFLVLIVATAIGACVSFWVGGDTGRALAHVYLIDCCTNIVGYWFSGHVTPILVATWASIIYLAAKHVVAILKVMIICWVWKRSDTAEIIGFPGLLGFGKRSITSDRVDKFAAVAVVSALLAGWSVPYLGVHTNALVWLTPVVIILGYYATGVIRRIEAWERALKQHGGYTEEALQVARNYASLAELNPNSARNLAAGINASLNQAINNK